jgi:phosphatidylglycerophosphate synthase
VGGSAVDPEPLPSAFAPGQTPRERVEAGAERTRLTFRRLSGLDRSGPPPPATLAGQPLHPWTVPNAIGYVRLGLIPVFLRSGLKARDGIGHRPAALFAIIAWSDYADGIAARVTGQYSRLGTLLDPLVDRLLVLAGVAVCWRHRLLPRRGLLVLIAREASMLWLARWGIRRGLDMTVNWFGRAGVWPVMSAPFFAMIGRRRLAVGCLYTGLPLMLLATQRYLASARAQLRARQAPDGPSSSG